LKTGEKESKNIKKENFCSQFALLKIYAIDITPAANKSVLFVKHAKRIIAAQINCNNKFFFSIAIAFILTHSL